MDYWKDVELVLLVEDIWPLLIYYYIIKWYRNKFSASSTCDQSRQPVSDSTCLAPFSDRRPQCSRGYKRYCWWRWCVETFRVAKVSHKNTSWQNNSSFPYTTFTKGSRSLGIISGVSLDFPTILFNYKFCAPLQMSMNPITITINGYCQSEPQKHMLAKQFQLSRPLLKVPDPSESAIFEHIAYSWVTMHDL